MPTPLRTSAIILLGLVLSACGPASDPSAGGGADAGESKAPLAIVATTGMIADTVRAVAGEHAQVTALMGPGVDPHLYKPTRADIAAVNAADATFYNGLLLEGKMTDLFVRAATSGRKVFAVTELIDEARLLEPEQFQGHYDPHVWMDPGTWLVCVDAVREQMTLLDPAHGEEYAANAAAYKDQLAELDAYALQVLASVPQRSRVLVTAHDAFNYFGDRYTYEVVGIQGISTESEAGVRDIERIVSLIAERDIRAVFTESTVSRRNVEALVAGARARGQDCSIGGSLFSDAMGAPGTYEGTYVGMIDHNITTIARALGGDAPPKGLNGRLATQTAAPTRAAP